LLDGLFVFDWNEAEIVKLLGFFSLLPSFWHAESNHTVDASSESLTCSKKEPGPHNNSSVLLYKATVFFQMSE
jgi:hypothetical protein